MANPQMTRHVLYRYSLKSEQSGLESDLESDLDNDLDGDKMNY